MKVIIYSFVYSFPDNVSGEDNDYQLTHGINALRLAVIMYYCSTVASLGEGAG